MAGNLLSKGWNVLVSNTDAGKVEKLVSKGALACTIILLEASKILASNGVIFRVDDAAQTEEVLFGAHGLVRSLPSF